MEGRYRKMQGSEKTNKHTKYAIRDAESEMKPKYPQGLERGKINSSIKASGINSNYKMNMEISDSNATDNGMQINNHI
jgi:hypothetical protein